jgi:molybdopterin-guanine dinucleotide biosynthesis protein MobB
MKFDLPVVGFAAYSGTGKTTLLVSLLRLFTEQGLRVGVVKHAHRTFEIDYPGKDSYELRQAGASQVLVGSRKRWALMAEMPKPPQDALQFYLDRLVRSTLDLVLVEGFKPESIPKIELHRSSLGKPLLYPEDTDIIAVATDSPLADVPPIPVLDLNAPATIADFIIDRFKPARQTDR